MATKPRKLLNDNIYHIYNRGVEKRDIFLDYSDYTRFIKNIVYYQQSDKSCPFSDSDFRIADHVKPDNFEILAYCLMPNHFHLVLKQKAEDGIMTSMSQLSNSYTKYFNQKNNRVGHLFQDRYKAKVVTSDEQLLQLLRYVLLNPYTANLAPDIRLYSWTSYNEFFDSKNGLKICETNWIKDYFEDTSSFKQFVDEYADEAKRIGLEKKQSIL